MSKQVALIILDGWGYREEKEFNAIAKAKTPFFDYLWQNYPHSLLQASGEFVGLPDGQIGNSEIGHTTIGAGKIIDTDLVRINKSIINSEFDRNQVFQKMFEHINKHGSNLHIVGLIGDGGVHSYQEHLIAFIKLCAKKNINNLILHLITDGRDVGPYDSPKSIIEIQNILSELRVGKIATISGRYYAMDRDNNWDRLEKFTNYFFPNKVVPEKNISDIENEIKIQHKNNLTDEHIVPFVVNYSPIKENDAVFFFNYRSDRARMLSSRIIELKSKMNLFFATMTEYGREFSSEIVFPTIKIETTLAGEISAAGLSQTHIAETEKFPHATYFLNGGRETPYNLEEHVLLSSRKDVKTHDQAPEMRASAIADEAVKRIKSGVDLVFINFANADMVGHTANESAIISAIETVDTQLQKVITALDNVGGVAFITADHGNAELNFDQEKTEKHTAHTSNPVPAILTDKTLKMKDGSLQDIAPTILKILDIKIPKTMTGKVLF
jgi:2,3-bisphosphoglycerate-independent phosphoglycerate mutase